jgi:hypothetical protein
MRTLAPLLAVLLALPCACSSTAATVSPDALRRSESDADPRARALAERVVENLGGWDGWERTRCIEWCFFGGRRHVWDKQTGDWRLDDGSRVVLMNLHTRQGRVFENGTEVFDEVRKKEMLEQAWGRWVNDSYWMFLPWKLLDDGVKLRHAGTTSLPGGESAQLLELTFAGVGLTPRNRYLVAVGDESGRIEQWSYYADANDAEPKLVQPWKGWKRFGRIWLCTDHGDLPGKENADWRIAVHDEVPRAVFESPAPPRIP